MQRLIDPTNPLRQKILDAIAQNQKVVAKRVYWGSSEPEWYLYALVDGPKYLGFWSEYHDDMLPKIVQITDSIDKVMAEEEKERMRKTQNGYWLFDRNDNYINTGEAFLSSRGNLIKVGFTIVPLKMGYPSAIYKWIPAERS